MSSSEVSRCRCRQLLSHSKQKCLKESYKIHLPSTFWRWVACANLFWLRSLKLLNIRLCLWTHRNVWTRIRVNDGRANVSYSILISTITLWRQRKLKSQQASHLRPIALVIVKSWRSRKHRCQHSFKLRVAFSRRTHSRDLTSIIYRRYEVALYPKFQTVFSPIHNPSPTPTPPPPFLLSLFPIFTLLLRKT